MTAPTLLLSRQAADTLGAQIAAVFGPAPYRLLTPQDCAADATAAHTIDLAFLSRDVTGASGRTELAPELLRFYALLRAAPRLRWLQTHAAGGDRPIYAEMQRRGVAVSLASGANAEAVATLALTGILALARRLPALQDAQRRHAWQPLRGPQAPRDLRGQTAVVVGLGPVGREIARLLQAFGLRVIGVRRGTDACVGLEATVSVAALDTMLGQADWLVLACPLSAATRGLIDARRLALLPPGAHLVNIARGEIVVEDDVRHALESGRLAGAHLDVFAEEPLPAESPWWDAGRVIVTPHTAGHTAGHEAAVAAIFLDNLRRWCEGQTLRHLLA